MAATAAGEVVSAQEAVMMSCNRSGVNKVSVGEKESASGFFFDFGAG